MDKPFPLLAAEDIRNMKERVHRHQFNDNAIRHTRSLGDALGLERLGIHLVRLEPDHDSTQFHFHRQDEEFLYILEGHGRAEIGDGVHPVGPGDFMAFARDSQPHNLHNDSEQDLVYLMGGSRSEIDICEYPRIGRRMFRVDGKKTFVEIDDINDV